MKNQILFLFILLVLAAGFGCSKDCPVCTNNEPAAEKDYHLIYSYGNPGYWVYTFSTKTLKAVDSVSYSSFPFEVVQFTRDGRYACYSKPGVTWITDYATGDTIAIDNEHWGRRLSFSKDDRMVLVSESGEASVFRFPELDLLYSTQAGLVVKNSCFDPTENVAYITFEYEDSLLIVRFDSTGIHDHKIGLTAVGGTPKHGECAAVTPDGSILFLNLTTANGAMFLELRDTDSLGLIAEYYPSHNGPFIHPDGRMVFFLQGGTSWAVYALDLKTRIMKRVVDGADYPAFWDWRYLPLSQIDFTPDGRYAFLLSGAGLSGPTPILKLDLDTYEIVNAIYPQYGVSRAMRIYPLEIRGVN